MAHIEYRIDGRKVSSKHFISGINGKIAAGIIGSLEKKLSALMCPEHEKHPTVSVTGPFPKLVIGITGCCPVVEKLVHENLA